MHSTETPPPAASAAAYEQAYQMEFRGSAGEYFRIWMTNLLLSILTLGIYSAWAKVRNRKYLYGNTYLDGANFDYTARPLSILIGRILIVLVILGGTLWAGEDLLRNAAYAIFLVLLLPWALVRSYAFNARYTFYRNVGFSFIKTRRVYAAFYLVYTPVFLFILGWYALLIYLDVFATDAVDMVFPEGEDIFGEESPLLLALVVLLPLLFFLLLPPWMRAIHRLRARHMCWGRYRADFRPAALGWYFVAMVVLPPMAIASLALPVLAAFLPVDALDEDMASYLLPLIFALSLFSYLLFFIFLSLVRVMLFRLYWQGFVLPENGRIRCQFSAFAFAVKIILVNYLAVIFSLGLLHPWAQVRKIRYLARHTVLLLPAGALETIVAQNTAKEDAVGEELEAVEGFGLGIDIT